MYILLCHITVYPEHPWGFHDYVLRVSAPLGGISWNLECAEWSKFRHAMLSTRRHPTTLGTSDHGSWKVCRIVQLFSVGSVSECQGVAPISWCSRTPHKWVHVPYCRYKPLSCLFLCQTRHAYHVQTHFLPQLHPLWGYLGPPPVQISPWASDAIFPVPSGDSYPGATLISAVKCHIPFN